MTRIAQSQLSRRMLVDIMNNYKELERAGRQVSSGYKVEKPGDSDVAGAIQSFRNSLERVDSYQKTISNARTALTFQEDTIKQVVELMQKAKELATQGANETIDAATRQQMSNEIYQMRDQLVIFANSRYQGRYIYGQADNDDAPFDPAAGGYTVPASGSGHTRYIFDAELGTGTAQSVNVTEDISVRLTTSGDNIFTNAIGALETLGRALEGYDTTFTAGIPDGGGTAYTLPGERTAQTTKIQSTIDLIDSALNTEITPEEIDIGARLNRLDVATAVLDSTKQTANEALNDMQNADSASAISQYQQAQYSLQAAMQVTSKVLNLSILDYL